MNERVGPTLPTTTPPRSSAATNEAVITASHAPMTLPRIASGVRRCNRFCSTTCVGPSARPKAATHSKINQNQGDRATAKHVAAMRPLNPTIHSTSRSRRTPRESHAPTIVPPPQQAVSAPYPTEPAPKSSASRGSATIVDAVPSTKTTHDASI
jgi:hypothetical protein